MDVPQYEAGPLEPIMEARESNAMKYSPSPEKFTAGQSEHYVAALRPSTAHNEDWKEDFHVMSSTPKPRGDDMYTTREQSEQMKKSERWKQRQDVREKLNELFVNYADFSQEKGAFFIPYTGLNRIFRESNALSATQLNKFSVIVKQEVNNS